MAGLSQFSETQVHEIDTGRVWARVTVRILQVDRLFEDWDELEPVAKDHNVVFGVSTEDLFSRYSYYAKLVREKTKWENKPCGQAIDFQSILAQNRESPVDPELMIKIFVQEKLPNGQLLELTQNPTPAKEKRTDKSSDSIVSRCSRLRAGSSTIPHFLG